MVNSTDQIKIQMARMLHLSCQALDSVSCALDIICMAIVFLKCTWYTWRFATAVLANVGGAMPFKHLVCKPTFNLQFVWCFCGILLHFNAVSVCLLDIVNPPNCVANWNVQLKRFLVFLQHCVAFWWSALIDHCVSACTPELVFRHVHYTLYPRTVFQKPRAPSNCLQHSDGLLCLIMQNTKCNA